ncbi:Isotrichodermin C-15 hydroxylase [Sphaceloma murrayae]|uniref:Isotrichodermin C-15 hydroxylase n=1 Tax=Sphaceloma murrayae TaxID=2082308 RepID=A0A2K1QQG5_9PEZI|nr:Isotrichodermin C-15 hydroxylase [Sphaceloma murrayae]
MAPTPSQSPILEELFTPYNPIVLYALPITAALALHAAVQVREPYAHHVIVAFVLSFSGVAYTLQNLWHISLFQSTVITTTMTAIFLGALAISVCVYRVFFHPLRKIPGPLSCKLTMWSWVLSDWSGTRANQIRAMHQKYGDIVRIGPREISCSDPSALSTIYGPTGPAAKCTRGPWYSANGEIDVHSLQNEPTLPEHNRRRRDWDPAFSIRALSMYKDNIRRNADELMLQIARLATQEKVDIRECMMWFGFDVMGELGFGRSFGTVKAGKTSQEVHLVELGVRAINTMGNIPYISHIMRYLPSPVARLEAWLDKALDWRISHHGEKDFVDADVFAFLLGEQGKQRRKLNRLELRQDCMLMVVAGSDTTSNALTFCLFELAHQPDLVRRMRQELAAIFPSMTRKPEEFELLRDQAHLLNACIQESLRLWAPVPSGLQRATTTTMPLPTSNGEITVVPPDTIVSTHTYTMHLDERNFFSPEQFIPDRWIDAEVKEQTHNAKALSPFGYGVTGCIGKNLAFMEMRLVLALFVMYFDIDVDQEDAKAFRESVRDQFVIATGPLKLRVTPRKTL